MKTLWKSGLLGAALLLGSCANPDAEPYHTYSANDLTLAVGNSARMGCSCLFVMEMPESYCRAWVKASPDVAKVTFDLANKRVESTAFLSWGATARFVDEKRGCILE
jgi:hypothetical protein